ncbi:hypothetical protein ACJZ2D_011583 [Fusarium nematophilum]
MNEAKPITTGSSPYLRQDLEHFHYGRLPYQHFRGEYYQSPQLLGRLYREFEGRRCDTPPNTAIDNTAIRTRVKEAWQEWFLHDWSESHGDAGLSQYFEDLCIADKDGSDSMDDPDHDWTKGMVLEERDHYLEFRNRETVSGNLELDLFLGKQLYDFPWSFINNLFKRISMHLSGQGLVEITDRSLDRVRRLRTITQAGVELVYRRYLFLAWDIAVDKSQSDGGNGQGYAFICLYALFCFNLPITDG